MAVGNNPEHQVLRLCLVGAYCWPLRFKRLPLVAQTHILRLGDLG